MQRCLVVPIVLYFFLFSHVDLSFSIVPIFLFRLYPVGVKHRRESVKYVPIDIAVKAKNNNSLLVSFSSQSKFCLSKYFHISYTVACTRIKLNEFIGYAKPWNFEQYIYLLPSYKLIEISTIWFHDKKYTEIQVLTNIIVILVSYQEPHDLLWPLGVTYRNR